MTDRATTDRLLAALKPFAFLCGTHDNERYADTDGVIFPGSKAVVVMGDLRRAETVYEEVRTRLAEIDRKVEEGDAASRAMLHPECPACGAGALERFNLDEPSTGTKAAVTYRCGHTFQDETLRAALR